MTWAMIARAYEAGVSPPPTRRNPRLGSPRWVTVGGETKRLSDWVDDPRNVRHICLSTLSKRADIAANLTSAEQFFRATTKGGK